MSRGVIPVPPTAVRAVASCFAELLHRDLVTVTPMPEAEHAVTPLELLFDLVFVFAITQVTTLLTRDPTWHGLIRFAIGVGAGLSLTPAVVVGAALGVVVVSALWWLSFDVAAIFARNQLVEAAGVAQARLARDAYSYLHLPLVGGIVLFAFGLETALHHVHHTLATLPAVALCSGSALYLLGHVAFLLRATGHVFRRRALGGVVLLALIPAALAVPGLAAVALVAAVCSLVVAYEAIRYRAHRVLVRHPDLG